MNIRRGDEMAPRDDGIPEDDRIIGVAFRLSMLVLLCLAIVGGLLAWWFSRGPGEARIEEAALAGPERAAPSLRAPPPVRFTDVTAAAGIDFVHENGAYGERMLPETMGSGVAVLDFDSDGHQDLLFVNATHWPWRPAQPAAPQALYRNLGDGRFENVTGKAGLDKAFYGVGVATGDYDADGHQDVFITALGSNRLFRNTGTGKFEEKTVPAGVGGDPNTWSSSAAFFDYDRDGDLDLFVANYVSWSREIDLEVDYRLTGVGRAYGPPTNYEGTHSYLYRNDGGGRFSDVSAAAGIQVSNPATGRPAGKGLAVVPADLDGDGWTDLAVANDTVGNFLFRNTGEGGFEEIGPSAGLAFDNQGNATGAMGIDAATLGERGDLAVAIGNFANEMTSFYVARVGSGLFTDEAIVAGIGPDSRLALSFGLFFFDYDLDGRMDMLQTNGHVENEINKVQPSQHYAQPTQLFWNCGERCSRAFVKVPDESLGDLSRPVVGRAAAYLDYDGDGDLDVVITQVARRPLLLRNEQALGHHWLRLRLLGQAPNTGALGATVTLTAAGRVQQRVVNPTRSYLSQVELPVTFGIGEAEEIESLSVTWPDGRTEIVAIAGVDREVTVRQR